MQCASHQNPELSEPPLGLDTGAAGVGMAGSRASPRAMPVLGMSCTDTDAVLGQSGPVFT